MVSRTLSLLLVGCVLSGAVRAEVHNISAIITPGQEVPAPVEVPAGAGGFASLQFDDSSNELSWDIAWQQLSGPPGGMHFHSPAAVGDTAGVAVNIGDVSGLTNPSVGSTIVSDDFAASLLAGESYINVHTSTNGPGEIRGQANPANINLLATLNTAQEIPSPDGVPAGAGGDAVLAFDPESNLLGWNISWNDLSGPAVGMHFHGPAGIGETAGVNVNIGDISGLASPSIGSVVISDEFASQLRAGEWYINIHTAANGAGEIRGQVVPEPSASITALIGALGLLGIGRRRSR